MSALFSAVRDPLGVLAGHRRSEDAHFVSVCHGAGLAGLATIVGAFAAGVILHDVYFRAWGKVEQHRFTIRELIAPLEVIMVPIFFVLMGVQVKLETFLDLHVVGIAAGLIAAAAGFAHAGSCSNGSRAAGMETLAAGK